MDLFLGIDGGASGCRAVLADGSGRVLGHGRAGPANIHSDREGALKNILAASAAALGGRPAAGAVACLGLAGANLSDPVGWLAPRLPFARARILHDAVTAVAGALGGQDGIVAAIGTGAVFSRQTGGEVLTIGGWGLELGDEGAGAWLGRALLARTLRACDGLVAHGPLSREVLAELGGPHGIVAFAHAATAADLAAFAPRVMAAGVQDAVAGAILAAAMRHVGAAIDRLQEGRALPVSFCGGLGPSYARLLAGRWPLVAPLGTPCDGALRLARELATATPAGR